MAGELQGCQFRFPYGGTDGGGQRSDRGGLKGDLRQSREVKKIGFQMLKKKVICKTKPLYRIDIANSCF